MMMSRVSSDDDIDYLMKVTTNVVNYCDECDDYDNDTSDRKEQL